MADLLKESNQVPEIIICAQQLVLTFIVDKPGGHHP